MTAIRLTVLGNPVPKGGVNAFYNPNTNRSHKHFNKKSIDWMQRIALVAQNYAHEEIIKDVPITIEAAFYFLKPPSAKKRKYPHKRPDVENLGKALMDGLQGIIFADDAQIVDLHLYKRYEDPPRVEILIKTKGD